MMTSNSPIRLEYFFQLAKIQDGRQRFRQNNELAYICKYEVDFDDLRRYIMRFDDAERIVIN